MPKKTLGNLPFPPMERVDTDTPIEPEALEAILLDRPNGVSICVRSLNGPEDRGGFFFHIRPKPDNQPAYELVNFEKLVAASFDVENLAVFMNHCSGLAFDEASFQLCQTTINFRLDPPEGGALV